MTRKVEPRNSDHVRQGMPVNATYAESIPRWGAAADNAISATGVALAIGIVLQNGDLVSNISFTTGGTAAGTPTAGFAALYSNATVPALLGQSADFGSTARAANSEFTVPLVTPVSITATGVYYVSISFTAGTIPTLRGATVGALIMSGAGSITSPTARKILAQSHGSAVGAVAPATITGATVVATIPYVVCT